MVMLPLNMLIRAAMARSSRVGTILRQLGTSWELQPAGRLTIDGEAQVADPHEVPLSMTPGEPEGSRRR